MVTSLRIRARVYLACGSLVALSVGLAVPVNAAPHLISLAYNGSLHGPQQIGADGFRQKLIELTAGDLAMDERGGNALGSEGAIVTAIRFGALDLAVVTGSVVTSAVPELGVFDIPFLFRDAAQAEAVVHGPVSSAIANKFADKGLVLLAIGKQGFRQITNSKRPIRVPADLNGLKMRVLPNEIYQMTFKALGADVVPMDFPLVYGALKDGRIDGQENPIATIAAGRLEEVQKYLTLTKHFFAIIVFIANRDTFERLNATDQAAIITAAQAGADATWRTGAEAEAKNIDHLRDAGMEIVETTDRQPFIDAMKPLEPEFERRFGKALLSTIRSTP
jgi:tripartite ATP-independent transporter DctP family solute receptor